MKSFIGPASPLYESAQRRRRITAGLSVLCIALVPMAVQAAPPRVDARAQDAMALGRLALDYFMKKQFRTAAEMYRRAAQVDPATVDYMYGVARAEKEDGRVAEAIAAYEEVIARTPANHALHVKSTYALAELRAPSAAVTPNSAAPLAAAEAKKADPNAKAAEAKAAADKALADKALADKAAADKVAAERAAAEAKASADKAAATKSAADKATAERAAAEAKAAAERAATAKADADKAAADKAAAEKAAAATRAETAANVAAPTVEPVAVPDVSPAQAWRKPVQWGSIGLGSAGVIASAIFVGLAVSAKSNLNAKKLPDGRYDDTKITVDEANSAISSINSKWAVAGVAGVVGLGALGVGVWLAVTDPAAKITLAPLGSGNGIALVGTF